MTTHIQTYHIGAVECHTETRDTQGALAATHKQERGRQRFMVHSPEREYVHPCDAAHIYDRRCQGVSIAVLAESYRLAESTVKQAIADERKRRSFHPLVVAR